MAVIHMSFGERLRALRTDANLSQIDIMNRLGINNKTMSGYEAGRAEPDHETLCKLADLFNVSTDYLLGRVDQPTGQKEAPSSDSLLHQVLDKLTRMERDIADLKKAAVISEKLLEKIEEHDVDIRLLKKLAAKE